MKRSQFIEWGVITLGLIIGFKFLETLSDMFVRMAYNFTFKRFNVSNSIAPMVFLMVVYAIICFLLIRNSKRIALFINGKNNDDSIPLKIGKRSLLQLILITICIVLILTKSGEIIYYLINMLTINEEDDYRDSIVSGLSQRFIVPATQIVLSIIVLYFHKTISYWFIPKDQADELIFDADNRK